MIPSMPADPVPRICTVSFVVMVAPEVLAAHPAWVVPSMVVPPSRSLRIGRAEASWMVRTPLPGRANVIRSAPLLALASWMAARRVHPPPAMAQVPSPGRGVGGVAGVVDLELGGRGARGQGADQQGGGDDEAEDGAHGGR